jgi:phage shock protein PspC (stress-responsive transcriptional regulator)
VRPFLSFLRHALIVVVLTLLTQIGGLAYFIALLATRRWRRGNRPRWLRAVSLTAATLLIYAIASWAMRSSPRILTGFLSAVARPPRSPAC